MKKVVSAIMAAALCSSFVCSNLANTGLDFINAEEYNNAIEWQNAYADTLKDYISSGVTKTAKFSLCYVDDNDIPELVIHKNGGAYHADTEVYLYTFYNGEIKNLGQISNDGYSNFTYYEKTGVVISGWSNQGLDSRRIHKLSDGEISLEHSYSSNEAAVASGGYSTFDDVRSDDAFEKYKACLPYTDPIHDAGEYALTEENINLYLSDNSGKVTSGQCGENAYWEFSNGTLTIKGNGETDGYVGSNGLPDINQAPWYQYTDYIKSVVIESGITTLGYGMIGDCPNLETVEFSDTVKNTGRGSFNNCPSLKSVVFPENIESIDRESFGNCDNLTSITIMNNKVQIGNWCFGSDRRESLDVYFNGTEEEWKSTFQAMANSTLASANFHSISAEELSESELKAKVEKYGTVSAWEYHDYDGNGTNEAFAFVTTLSGTQCVYFINSNGNIKLMPTGFAAGYVYEDTARYIELNGHGFFLFDYGAGGSGFKTYLYSVKDGESYELDISRELQGFYQNTETGQFYTTVSDFSSGIHERLEYELIYDSDNQQFSIGERLDGVVSEDVTSGKCGDNAEWNFNKSIGILTISGTGKMYDYATIVSEMPWKLHNNDIKRVVVEEGITGFYFNYNQQNQPNLDSFVIPKSVSSISGITADIDYTLVKEVTIYGYTGTEAEVYVKKHNDYIEEYYSETDKAKFKDKLKFYPLNGQLLSYISCPDSMVVSNKNGNYDTNIISVSLTVGNAGKYDLSDVFVNLNLPDGVRCDDINAGYEEWNGMNVPNSLPESFKILNDAKTKMKFSLKKNEDLTFNLVLYISNDVLDRNKTNYSHMVQENIVTFSTDIGAYDETNTNTVTKDIVSVVSTPTENIPKSFNIIHKDLTNNELSSNDAFKFLNYNGDFFNKNENHIYQLSDNALNKLLNAFDDNIVKAYVKTKRTKDGWYGSCYGISTVASLVKGGYLNLSDFGLNSDISKLDSPKKDAKVEDLINFYQLQQFLPYHQYNQTNSQLVDKNERLKEIVQETKKTSQGGLPVRINYSYEGTNIKTSKKVKGGHAVVGYKCECVTEMDWLGNHRVVANENDSDFHEYQITIYDCSQTSSGWFYTPTYMYIGKNYDYWWYEPVHGEINLTKADISTVSSSSEELNLVDYKTGKKSSMCPEHFEKNFLSSYAAYSNVHISTSEGSSELSGLGEGEGNLYTYTVPDVGTIYDEDGNIISFDSYTTYFDDDFKDEDITIKLENTGECDFSMIYTNCMVSAGGNKVNKVDMKSAGAVNLIADNSDYELALTFNEGYYTMPWYTITASGDETNDVSMKQTEDGIVFNSDNMENVTITANNTDEIVELTFTADTDNVLITNNKNDLEVYADTDNNGTYETLVKTTSSVVNNNNQNSSNSSSNNTATSSPKTGDSFPKIFTLLATATFGAVISRKHKNNKI